MDSFSDWVTLVASLCVVGMAVFQVLLAAGYPYGAAAFGGGTAVLPTRLRIASAISATLFCGALYVVLAEGGLFGAGGRTNFVHVATWIFVAIFALSGFANSASRSRWERHIMAPLALLLTSCCVLLALVR
jgi:ABC-type maltose transport system permease subunit